MNDEKQKNKLPAGTKLGDQWSGWDGNLKREHVDARTTPLLFGLLFLFAVLLSSIGIAFILYMISPRVSGWGSAVNAAVTNSFLAVITIVIIAHAIVQIAAIFKISLFSYFIYRFFPRLITLNIPMLAARLLGIPKDRMSNSYVRFHNNIVRGMRKKIPPERLLVLLPRCLTKETRERILSLCASRGCPVIVAAGGEMARDKVRDVNPAAVIAVACERDLHSGILEVMRKVTVVGVANTRPKGPCALTEVDIAEIEAWMRHFLGDAAAVVQPKA
ncbi:MAG: DUF116 domain-containing protein [Spirochaetes bacterium]|nr:DUF116 domain-containing protein [Spirochaetota bacterium]